MDENGLHSRRYRRVAVIANPRAGSTTPEYLASVEAVCQEHAEQVQIAWTRRPGHATQLVGEVLGASMPPDVLVSIGGDGTLREVVTGLMTIDAANRPPLVVLPGGTANSNYRSLWDDVPWHQALVSALSGEGSERRNIDLARISSLSRLIVLGLSTGLFADATARALSLPVAGRARYQQAIAETLTTYRPYDGRVLVDGAVVHSGKTVLVNVGGGRHRAGVLQVLPHSIRDDGMLDVCVVDPAVPTEQVLELMREGQHLKAEGTTYARGRSITLERLDGLPLHFEHDGEAVPTDQPSITIEVLPRALPVLVSRQRTGG